MVRPHLIISPDPKLQCSEQIALCGAVVPNSVWIPLMDDETPTNLRNMCKSCRDLASGGGFYYALVTGESLIHDEF